MKIHAIALAALIIGCASACKKDSTDQRTNNLGTTYRPHLFATDFGNSDEEIGVFDASNPQAPKADVFRFNNISGMFEFVATYDSISGDYGNSGFDQTFFRKWPVQVSDPVGADPTFAICGSSGEVGFIDRHSTQDSVYSLNGNKFLKVIFSRLQCSFPANAPVFSGVFGSDMYADKIDAYIYILEEGILDANPFPNYQPIHTQYYFNFDNATFFCQQYDFGYFQYTPYTESEKIDKLVTKPAGNMDVNPIDFKLADAAFVVNGQSIQDHDIYFLDYDAMKYVQVRRLLQQSSLSNSDSARFNLVTISWQPMSSLFTGWRSQ
jgi:hypothetical protein